VEVAVEREQMAEVRVQHIHYLPTLTINTTVRRGLMALLQAVVEAVREVQVVQAHNPEL
jgi:hypothetical protein